MAKPRPGMGRGLERDPVRLRRGRRGRGSTSASFRSSVISPNPHQPRRSFDEEALAALAGSLGEQGVMQPVLVRPRPGGSYELVAGERRWRAAQHGRARDDSGADARSRGRGVARSRADREHGARGSQPGRGGACMRGARRGARPDARGGRPAGGAQPGRRQQPDAASRPSRRGAGAPAAAARSARAMAARSCSPRTTARRRRLPPAVARRAGR